MFRRHLPTQFLVVAAIAIPLFMASFTFSQGTSGSSDRELQPVLKIEIRRIWYPEQDRETSSAAMSVLLQNIDLSQVRIKGGDTIPVVSDKPGNQPSIGTTTLQPESIAVEPAEVSCVGQTCYVTINLTDDQYAELLERVKSDARWSISQAPTVQMHAKESAVIADVVQRPFVTGLKSTEGGTFTAAATQPEIRIFQEGTTMKITTSEMIGNNLNLSLQFRQSEIHNVKTLAFKNGDGPDANLQFPEAETKVSEVNISTETGRTVLVLLGTSESLERVERGVPVPGLDRVFRRAKATTRAVRKTEALLVTVTGVSDK